MGFHCKLCLLKSRYLLLYIKFADQSFEYSSFLLLDVDVDTCIIILPFIFLKISQLLLKTINIISHPSILHKTDPD